MDNYDETKRMIMICLWQSKCTCLTAIKKINKVGERYENNEGRAEKEMRNTCTVIRGAWNVVVSIGETK